MPVGAEPDDAEEEDVEESWGVKGATGEDTEALEALEGAGEEGTGVLGCDGIDGDSGAEEEPLTDELRCNTAEPGTEAGTACRRSTGVPSGAQRKEKAQ